MPDIPDLSFRFYKTEDKNRCVEIYQAIETLGQIPGGMVDDFVDYLESVDVDQRVFVILSGETIVATCGLKSFDSSVFLLYGLIHPSFQKKGLGAVMLALRAEELSSTKDMIALSPTKYSTPYYKRLGFIHCFRVGDEVYAEGDDRLSEVEQKDIKSHMYLMVDEEAKSFMRSFLEHTFNTQLSVSRV